MALQRTLSAPTRRLDARERFVTIALTLSCLLACSGEDGADDSLSSGAAGSSGNSGTENGGTPGSSTPLVTENELARAMVEAHNAVRGSAEEPLLDLEWSDALAAHAAEWADELARGCSGIRHRDQNRYGENIAMRGSSRVTEAFSPEEAVAGWSAEAACWEFGTVQGSESCDPGCVAELNSNGCGHYTQIIWANTTSVGCGYASCESSFNVEIWVCNYDPPGNFVGQAPY